MLKKPGRKPRSATASSTTTARAWEAIAKSTIVSRLRLRAALRLSPSAVTVMSLQSHDDAVGCAACVYDGEPHEARPVRRKEQRAASRRRRQRRPVDQHGERRHAARHLDRDRLGAAGIVACKLETGAVWGKHDAKLRLAGSACSGGRAESLQGRRQLPRRGGERALGSGRQRRGRVSGAGKRI